MLERPPALGQKREAALALPAYHKSIVFPLRLVVFSRHLSVSTTLPSRIRYGVPSARARSRAPARPGARAASTSITSSRYRYAVDCASPKPRPSRGMSPLVPEPRQPEQRLPVAAQPAGSPPRPDLAAVAGQQAGNEPDQVPGHVEHDTIGDHAEPLPGSGCSSARLLLPGAPRLPGDLRVCPRVCLDIPLRPVCPTHPWWENLTDGGRR